MSDKTKCPECNADSWEECSIPCEDCGDHAGYRCKECGHPVDSVYDDELYCAIQDLMENDE